MKAAFLAAAVLAAAGVVFYFGAAAHAAKGSRPGSAAQRSVGQAPASKSFSIPLFFEPNQGQTAPPVKFLAHGAGYSLFLTADEAVLALQPSAVSHPPSAVNREHPAPSVIRMRLDGANASVRVSGASLLPGKSSYFIGNDPSKWRRGIPQFARVEYQSVYPGIDMVYHGDQGHLEYDLRVAPGAEPNQIALSFTGASAHIVSGDSEDSGDLVLSTASGDVRFHAPRVYQPAMPDSGNSSGSPEKTVAGSFRQLADNKIGFTVGDYDHYRELVIDPVLSYSTYLGGSGTEGLVKVAVDGALNIYLAGSTNSTNFPLSTSPNPPLQSQLLGSQNIFIAKINPLAAANTTQLLYATYLGSSGTDSLAGLAVDSNFGIYVAGTTTSTCSTTSTESCFPTTSNAFQTGSQVAEPGTHGFLSQISLDLNLEYTLTYSTYFAGTNAAGNPVDHVTGLAIDATNQNAYVTGDTTSSNSYTDGFPANSNGYQLVSNSPGNPQFFASKIDTAFSGSQSMLYSTYFGGGNPASAIANGGGVAVDLSGNTVNMYITGTTNMLPGTPTVVGFPLLNAQQSCLNEASVTSCNSNNPTAITDAFVAKINPNQVGTSSLVYSTYLGGSGTDAGLAIAVDSSSNAYVVGSTNSGDWVCKTCTSGFQTGYNGNGNTNGFMVKVGNASSGAVYPLNYFTYLGGSGPDSANAIQVDSVQTAHIVGSTGVEDLLPVNPLPPADGQGLGGDAFVALISTTLSGQGVGDYLTYLGGSQLDQGTGVAIDTYNATYAAGVTQSLDFPVTPTAYQPCLDEPGIPNCTGDNSTAADAFVSKLGAYSQLLPTNPTTSPSPNPVAAGNQVAFTFNITNQGPDTATNVTFNATVPSTGLASNPTAKVTSGAGSCGTVSGTTINTIQCNVPTLTVNAIGTFEVDVTPSDTANPEPPKVSVSGSAFANGGGTPVNTGPQSANVVDFGLTASTSTPVINAGDTAVFQVKFSPTSNLGYSGTITPSQSTTPSMVTATVPTFNPTSVTLSGSSPQTTALSIATVARPVTTGSLLRRGSFYAAWLPIGGLSLLGLGIGASRKRRRWLFAAVLGLIAGVILLQPGCGSSSSSTTTTGGTLAGIYYITITGSAGTGASHTYRVQLQVD